MGGLAETSKVGGLDRRDGAEGRLNGLGSGGRCGEGDGRGGEIVNRISQQIVEELTFDHALEPLSKGIIGLCSDTSAGLFYAHDESSILQVSVHDEGRDMWQVYLDMKEHITALAYCRNPLQRDQVYLEQADAAFSLKVFYRAASFYAKALIDTSVREIYISLTSCYNDRTRSAKGVVGT